MAMYDSHPTRTTHGLSDLIKERLTSTESWVLPKQESCIAPEGVWSNKDMVCSEFKQPSRLIGGRC